MRIIILGAGPGLARSVAKLFGNKGFSVSLVGRNENRLQVEVAELTAQSIEAEYLVADVANETELAIALEKLDVYKDVPDVLLYNAFSFVEKGLLDESWENVKVQLDVNVGGAFNLLKAVLPILQQKNKGKIFFTGGGFGLYPQPNFTGLSMGKAALKNLVGGVASGLDGSNVHVASVVVCGMIGGEDPKYAPDRIALNYWTLYSQQQGQFETEIVY